MSRISDVFDNAEVFLDFALRGKKKKKKFQQTLVLLPVCTQSNHTNVFHCVEPAVLMAVDCNISALLPLAVAMGR